MWVPSVDDGLLELGLQLSGVDVTGGSPEKPLSIEWQNVAELVGERLKHGKQFIRRVLPETQNLPRIEHYHGHNYNNTHTQNLHFKPVTIAYTAKRNKILINYVHCFH